MLSQFPPPAGFVEPCLPTFSRTVPGRIQVLNVACMKCDRRGRYKANTLA
jgi:hypothetical protein